MATCIFSNGMVSARKVARGISLFVVGRHSLMLTGRAAKAWEDEFSKESDHSKKIAMIKRHFVA